MMHGHMNMMQLINYSYLLQRQAEAHKTNLTQTGSIGYNNIVVLYQSHNIYNFLFTVYGAIISYSKFYVLLTVHLSISLDNDQLDAHLLYFTIRPLQSSTCFEHYVLIVRRLNCIDAASGIVLSVTGRPVHRLRENCSAVLSQLVHRTYCKIKQVCIKLVIV